MLIYCISAIIAYNLIDKYKQKLYFYPSNYVGPTRNRIININNHHFAITNTNINPNKLKLNKPCLLISHGNAGNISNRDVLLEMLSNYDGDIYCYEYKGFGYCLGSVSINGCIEEHMVWLDRLSQKYPQIDVWGESIGGGILIETLCRLNEKTHENIIKKIGKIYLQSTFSSLYNVVKSINENLATFYYLLMFDDLEICKSLGHGDYLSKFRHNEINIIHSKQDEIIPFDEAKINYNQCLKNNLNVKLIEIKGSHNLAHLNNFFIKN
jgi:hypothetical protein